MLNIGYHLLIWREAIGAILPKPNKPDYSVPKAYRIIALLNCLGKVSEKIIANRLAIYSEERQILHPSQFGRKQRSAIDAAMSLVNQIEEAKSNKLITSVLFLDVKGAFDNVSKTRLLDTLHQMALPIQIIQWVEHFMTMRLISLAFDRQTESQKPVETGIPQGSPTSPILFLLYMAPLYKLLEQKHKAIYTPNYIDDVSLVATGKIEKLNIEELEKVAKTAFQ